MDKSLQKYSMVLHKEFIQTRLEFFRATEHEEILIVVLRAHLYIERELGGIIKKSLMNPEFINLERMNFVQKLNLVHACGLLDQSIYKSIQKFNNIRNGFAHRLDYRVDDNSLDGMVSCLSAEKKRHMENDVGEFFKRYQITLVDRFRLVLSYLHAELIINKQISYVNLQVLAELREKEQIEIWQTKLDEEQDET